MATTDSSTVCVFGEKSTNRKKCVLITFNTKREEKVVAEVDYRWDCAFGCVSGANVFFKIYLTVKEMVKFTIFAIIVCPLLFILFFKILPSSSEVFASSGLTPTLLMK